MGARGFWSITTTIVRFGEVGRGGDVAKFKAEYRRCRRCQEQPKCKAMCVDVCCDEIKGNKEWWAFNFERLAANDNPWGGMPKEMLEYIKNLPEYNKDIFNKITGGLDV